MTEKVCFLPRISRERMNEYVERHKVVRPAITGTLHECGYIAVNAARPVGAVAPLRHVFDLDSQAAHRALS